MLEEKINQISSTKPEEPKDSDSVEEKLRYMTDAKNKAEKEKARLETNIEKMKQLTLANQKKSQKKWLKAV